MEEDYGMTPATKSGELKQRALEAAGRMSIASHDVITSNVFTLSDKLIALKRCMLDYDDVIIELFELERKK